MRTRVTLTIKGGRLDGQEYVLDHAGTHLVGRRQGCDIRLPTKPEFMGVSRHHCILELTPSQVRVRDCGSRNGTRVNGMQIGRPAAWMLPPNITALPYTHYDLRDGDELRVADVVFRIRVSNTHGNHSHDRTELAGSHC
jgi:pSer/pThr/pTyr-binding forkhead associated (FHA) protein